MQLKLSAPKCKVLILNKFKTQMTQCELFIREHKLEEVDEMNDLGIIIDNKLSFNSHCSNKAKQASKIINFFFCAFKTRSTSFLLQIYKTYVLPILDYGSIIYNSSTTKNIKVLESVQSYFTKRIPQLFFHNYGYYQRLEELHLESLVQRRKKLDLFKVYSIIYGHCDIYARDFFDFSINNNNTRTNGLKLRPEKCRYNIRKNLFSNRIVEAWNNLSRTAVTARNIASFKREIDKEMQY